MLGHAPFLFQRAQGRCDEHRGRQRVLTPAGPRLTSQVHEVEPGRTVRRTREGTYVLVAEKRKSWCSPRVVCGLGRPCVATRRGMAFSFALGWMGQELVASSVTGRWSAVSKTRRGAELPPAGRALPARSPGQSGRYAVACPLPSRCFGNGREGQGERGNGRWPAVK
jgi:hypothetical protein